MNNFFVKYKSGLSTLIFLILIGGVFTYSKMQTSLFPEITFPKIKIIADAGQQPVDKMMITVTKPLENAIKKIPNLKNVRSTTSRGSCEISAFMDWNSDLDVSKQQIESRINQIRTNLPASIQITVEKMNPSILPVIGYAIESKNRTPIEVKKIANYVMKPFFSQVEGVSEVRVIGGKEKEYWIELDQNKMTAYGITPDAVSQVLSQTNFITSNGYLADNRYLYLTLTDAQITNKSDIENLVVSNKGKGIITLKNIATVAIEEAKEYIKVNANGKESVLIAVIKQPNANLITMSTDMELKLHELRKIIPKDVKITPYYEQSTFVNDAVKVLQIAY